MIAPAARFCRREGRTVRIEADSEVIYDGPPHKLLPRSFILPVLGRLTLRSLPQEFFTGPETGQPRACWAGTPRLHPSPLVASFMEAPRKAALLWSGGKDSALALHHARQDHSDIDITMLVTCVSEAYDRVSMHGVCRRLIEDQAESLRVPVQFVVIPSPPSPSCPMAHATPGTTFPANDVYSRTMLAAFSRLRAEGIAEIVFGDIYLEDLRAYRDQLLAHAGLVGRYPLWGRDTAGLYDEFIGLGFAAVTVCIDTNRLPAALCGQRLDSSFRKALPSTVDPCGEKGEYHSFTFGGPLFRYPVRFSLGDVHYQNPFAFQELRPEPCREAPANPIRVMQ